MNDVNFGNFMEAKNSVRKIFERKKCQKKTASEKNPDAVYILFADA